MISVFFRHSYGKKNYFAISINIQIKCRLILYHVAGGFFFFLKSLAELFLAAFLERHSYSNALPALIKLRDLSF